MHCCEFCHSQFEPRRQVKNPRACGEERCQRLRQQGNERSWRARHSDLYDGAYHSVKRRQRQRVMGELVKRVCQCFKIGASMLGLGIDELAVAELLERFFARLGVRRVNKLCMS